MPVDLIIYSPARRPDPTQPDQKNTNLNNLKYTFQKKARTFCVKVRPDPARPKFDQLQIMGAMSMCVNILKSFD